MFYSNFKKGVSKKIMLTTCVALVFALTMVHLSTTTYGEEYNENVVFNKYKNPRFIMELKPEGNKGYSSHTVKGNVVQGFAVDKEENKIYTTHDSDSNKHLVVINEIDMNTGISLRKKEVISYHGQDLSLEVDKESGKKYLWMTNITNDGLYVYEASNFSLYSSVSLNEKMEDGEVKSVFNKGASFTPTISLDQKYLAFRRYNNQKDQNKNEILIYDFNAVKNSMGVANAVPVQLYKFELHKDQQAYPFQGIAVDDSVSGGIVYCLSGHHEREHGSKTIYAYSFEGKLLGKYVINIDIELSKKFGVKYEPEGLSLVLDKTNNKKELYFSLMFTNPDGKGNVRRLYAFADPYSYVGGKFNKPSMFYYKSGSGDVRTSWMEPELFSQKKLGKLVYDREWTEGWTNIEAFKLGDQRYLFHYKRNSGLARINMILPDSSIGSAKYGERVYEKEWKNDWTHFSSFQLSGKTYLFYYSSTDRRAIISELSASSFEKNNLGKIVYDKEWETGWDSFKVFKCDGRTYLFYYKTDTKRARISELNAESFSKKELGKLVYNKVWTEGWTDFETFTSDRHMYLFQYKSSSNLAKIVELDPSRFESENVLGKKVYEKTWTAGWTSFKAFYVDNNTYFLQHKKDEGSVYITEINANNMEKNNTLGNRLYNKKWSSGWTDFVFID